MPAQRVTKFQSMSVIQKFKSSVSTPKCRHGHLPVQLCRVPSPTRTCTAWPRHARRPRARATALAATGGSESRSDAEWDILGA